MATLNKISQLQIRVSRTEKSAIQRAAKLANMDMPSYVLARVLPPVTLELQALFDELRVTDNTRFTLSAINTVLTRLNSRELRSLDSIQVPAELTSYLQNYVAAMVEYVCIKHQVTLPHWTKAIVPLKEPVFVSGLLSLRLYLLTHSPAPFRRRNIFVDTTIGGELYLVGGAKMQRLCITEA